MNWIEIAQNLPLGHNQRVDCSCGTGKTAVINHNANGYSYWCFRCDERDFEPKGKQTLADLARIRELSAIKQPDKVDLPNDFTTEIPLEGRLWLYGAGLTQAVWEAYGFGYSEYYHRVIMPVYDEAHRVTWWQGRSLDRNIKPKYLQPTANRDTVLFKSRPIQRGSTGRIVIVTEDILSAIRVGKHVDTISLLGTKATTSQLATLSKYQTVCTWLDSDMAGRQGAYKIRKALSLTTNVANIVTEQDPKLLSDEEIRNQLCILTKTM